MPDSTSQKKKKIAIIGAGACGICAAKTMKQAGFEITVFEIGSQIGGMWCYENDNGLSSAYRTLHINTSRNVTRFPDLDFKKEVQSFPDHRDMHQYLEYYAEHFGVTEHIRFNTPVSDIKPLFTPHKEDPLWKITTQDGQEEIFDSVMVASGHLHVPRHIPEYQDQFAGQYLHSHDYKAPEPFVGKRICIVGVGNSACDIAGDVCVNSTRCVLVARSGVLILPKLIFGRPFTDLSSKLQRPWIPYGLRRTLIKAMTWLMHGDMEKLGFRKPDKRVHVTSNGTIVTDIAYRRVEVKQGISRIEGQTIWFEDGSHEEFDVLIGATGYRTELPFLSNDVVQIGDNKIDLYKRIVVPDWPGLYLMGFFNTDTALNFIFDHQAKWVREIELGNAVLPSPDTMRADIRQREQWVANHFRETPRHKLEEESVPYIKALKKSMGMMKKLRNDTTADATSKATSQG
ncbi:MAG: NAD(P)-binding domain-containing protein [Burkholderiaceae bacterium]